MKKRIILTLGVVALAISSAFAQKVTFPLNEDGKIFYSNEFKTDKSKSDLFENVNLWIASNFGSGDAIISKDAEKGEIVANATKQAKSSYNPFSGAYNEFVTVVMKFYVSDGKIRYTLDKPTLTGVYVGYGSKQTTEDMEEKYANYVKAYQEKEAIENDETLSKRDKKNMLKEKEEEIEDMEDSLFEAGNSIQEIVEMIESGLFK
jgi:hypothetical protein